MRQEIADKVDHFFGTYPQRSYPKGQILVFADENPEHIFYLVKGRVRKYDVSYRGDEMIVNVFKSPSFFPMSWAIDRIPNRYFYKTEAPTLLHIVPAEDALQFIKDNPDVMLDLLARVYRGTEGLLGRMIHLMSGTAKSRLVYELILECRRFSNQEESGSYRLSATEIDLAARSGLSRETVSREMHKLKAHGWVSIEKANIVVTDMPALERSLGTVL
ncbi:MAG TPA: Crp/Fnr family transcriptional regulator [Candidatus Saccharimonadales bacterium]|nr:Crp/Fnr family transcriptional regulator [Candidatus Saccharimonadales bacterium]